MDGLALRRVRTAPPGVSVHGRASYKVVLMGDSGVGKTSLIRRYVRSYFDEGYLATIGTTVSKHVEVVCLEDGKSVEVGLTIWDIMGSKKVMELLGDAYFYGARGALAVFDVTRRETLEGLGDWIQAAHREDPRMPILVLGNKSDLEAQRRVSEDEVRDYCRDLGCPYLPTSAKTGFNVETAFRQLCRELLKTYASFGAGEPPPGTRVLPPL